MITKDEIFIRINKIIADDLEIKLNVKIEPETSFKTIGMDSIQLMQLYVLIEENFCIEFGEELIGNENFTKMKDICNYIYELNTLKG